MRDATSASLKARLRAVQALGDLEDPTARRRAAAVLTVALQDDHAAVRAEATAALGHMAELAPVPALIARLDDGDAVVRQHAAIALGTLRDRAGFAPLLETMRNGPADLRFQAVTSLAEIDPVASYQPLLEALTDHDEQVVGAAAIALGRIGDGRAVLHLSSLLTHAQPTVRFEAAWALAELGDARGRDELVARLSAPAVPAAHSSRAGRAAISSDHPGQVIEAVESLARLGSAQDRRVLTQFLSSRSAPAEALVVAARHVLTLADLAGTDVADDDVAADRSAAQRVLLAALTARKDHVRGLAVEQLAEVGGPWAEPALAQLRSSWRGRSLAEPIDDALAAIASRNPPAQAGSSGQPNDSENG